MNVFIPATLCYLGFLFGNAHGVNQCQQRVYDAEMSAIVCVCNATYCDDVQAYDRSTMQPNQAAVYTSSKSGKRLEYSVMESDSAVSSTANGTMTITIDTATKHQQIIGFGGAFTDAAGINIMTLSPGSQQNLMNSYFSKSGIQYTIGRIPMASCDFSTHRYSYDDVDQDFSLTNFSLANEDYKYKIPFLLAAQNLSNNSMRYFGSPWSAPAWMKTSGKMAGNGTLKGKAGDNYHKTWAEYFVRFLQEYKKSGVSLWGLTAQNEPLTGFMANYHWQTMGFTGVTEGDFIAQDLGPALASSGFQDVALMILDDQRFIMPMFVDQLMSNSAAAPYVSGVAVHWYVNFISPVQDLDYVHSRYPEKFILSTEACVVQGGSPSMGNWARGNAYAHDIIDNMNHWTTGWVDWNLALDPAGGPNWAKNYVDSPIIINKTSDEFYKQPMFYAMGHFSKFAVPDSYKIPNVISEEVYAIETAAFLRPDNTVAIVVLNRGDTDQLVQIKEKTGASTWTVDLEANSIKTILIS